MTLIPIVEQLRASPDARQMRRVEQLAERIVRERSDLAIPDEFRPLLVERLEAAPTLHLDDLSGIPLLDHGHDVSFMQDRALLRAGDGDLVVTCTPANSTFEQYCATQLGLGAPLHLSAEARADPLRVAEACWEDRHVRRALIHAMRSGNLRYVHPHMGNFPVWELAALLQKASRCSLQVIAPPPSLNRWVNDKIAFAEAISELFGPAWIPRTEHAFNFATLSERVRQLVPSARRIGLKLPDSAGGGGNLVLESNRLQGCSLEQVCRRLKAVIPQVAWEGESPLLIDVWETEVICDASIQVWIPPAAQGPPIVEGLFEQMLEGHSACFIGSRPVRLPKPVEQEIVDRCYLVSKLYQLLKYVGRCSFDVLLVGERLEESQLKFVECNGRWGGTSLPMTLMNRLFGNWRSRCYANRECHARGLNQFRFADLLRYFANELFDVRSGQGRFVFYNPGRMQAHSGINVLALADTWEAADHAVRIEFPEYLQAFADAGPLLASDDATHV